METEDLIKLPASSNSGNGSETDDTSESGFEAIKLESLPPNSDVIGDINGEPSGVISAGLHENTDTLMADDFERDADSNTPAPPISLKIKDSVAEVEEKASVSFVHAENGSLSVQSEISFGSCKKNETLLSKREVDSSSSSGLKRPRMTVDEQQPSVHVVYSYLPRASKQKLEKLLEQWSQWHAQNCSSSDDSNVMLESGEETYFPALRVGVDKPSAVTFWVDNQTKTQSSKEFIPLDGTSVPLYDRGYSLALTSTDGSSGLDGGVEKLDTSRCFNCGSYSHALKDCPKPRDNTAVNNARKQHKSKRNQHANARKSIRYYQSSHGGKYDGLMPGVLDAETRQLLGLGELDPPPWLNRMREIGYPPGYLDADMEDQPSGITIFGDEANKEENEEGEILDASYTEPSKKMTVEFPGINAPIPENANERLWAPSSSSYSQSRHGAHRRYNHSSESSGRGYHSEQRRSRDWEDDAPKRWARYWEDEGPPGCEPGTSPSLSHLFFRYGEAESGHHAFSPRASPSTPWSSSYGRSFSDRGRRSPLRHDASLNYDHYGSFPYSSPR